MSVPRRAPLRIASQLGQGFDAAILAQTRDLPIALEPIARGAGGLGPGAEVLFAFPYHQAGEAPADRPAGWPFDYRWVQLVSTGADLYPDWLLQGPAVTSARGSLAAPIAEFCLALILAAAKRLPEVWAGRPEEWRLRRLGPVEGAALGIFGFGAIGRALAQRALALGLIVYATRRTAAPMPEGVIRVDDLAALARVSDHLVLAAPATAETRGAVSRAVLSQAKPGLHLINVARGVLIDDDALLDALAEGRVGLASLDVTEPEPLPAGHPFWGHPKVRLSPHIAVMAPDAEARVAALLAENVRLYLAGAPLANVISADG